MVIKMKIEKNKKLKYHFVIAVVCWIVCLVSFLLLGLLPVMFGLANIVITIFALIIEGLISLINNRKALLKELLKIRK